MRSHGWKLFAGMLAIVGWALLPQRATADRISECEAAAGGRPFVCYDHLGEQWVKSIGEVARAGDPLSVVIIHTNPAHITAVVAPVLDPEVVAEGLGDGCATNLTHVETVFAEEGRYSLEIDVTSPCGDLAKVAATEFKVDVLDWEQAVAGAFTGSDHHDPLFSTYTRTVGTDDLTFVEREPNDRENEVRLGLGSFIHLYHEGFARKHPWAPSGFSFGLGIGEQNRTSYSIGPSWRIGDKAFLTVGWNWAPVDRLPVGVRTCARSAATCDAAFAVADANAIGTLDQRTEGALFVGLSYTFIELGNFFQDRFQEAIEAGSGTTPDPPADPTPAGDDPPSGDQPPAAAGITTGDLTFGTNQTDYAPGDAVELTVASAKAPAGENRLRVAFAPSVLEAGELGDWEACPGVPDCFQQQSGVFQEGVNSVLRLEVKDDAPAGSNVKLELFENGGDVGQKRPLRILIVAAGG